MIDRGFIGAAAIALLMASPAGAAVFEPQLARDLGNAAPSARVTAIATVARPDDRRTARRARALGLDVIRFEHLPFLGVRGTRAELGAVAALRSVRRLSANAPIVPALGQSRDLIRASAVHADLGVTGKGVGVAVLDSGADGEHPDLEDALSENVSVVRERDIWAVGVERPQQMPETGTIIVPSERDVTSGHGTHVAGIVGGRGIASDGRNRGIAPGADLIAVGHGDGGAVLFALAGMDYILEHRERLNIQILNASFQTTNDRTLFPYDPELPVNVASKALHAAGIAVVFAAGNWGPQPGTLNAYAPWPWVLGVANGCIAGKSPLYSDCSLHDSSSRGIPGDPLLHPDITAPGTGIVSAKPPITDPYFTAPEEDLQGNCGTADPLADFRFYTCRTGTSMAAPHVAGVMALLEEAAGCDLHPDELFALVTGTAAPMPAYAEWEAGSGFLDARAAVDRVRAERDELCGRKSGKPRPRETPRAARTALRLDPRPVVSGRGIHVGLKPSGPVWSVRIVARRRDRVVASRRLGRLEADATVTLRVRRRGRGSFRVVAAGRDGLGRAVRASAQARVR